MRISIIGCGWLGLPLAQKLVEEGHIVRGTTTTLKKLQLLENSGIEAHLLNLNNYDADVAAPLSDSEILIVNVPPKANNPEQVDYLDKMRLITLALSNSKINKVLFVSSTSVYADDNAIVTEETHCIPTTSLIQAEQLFRDSEKHKTTVLRFAGLIGNDRNPVNQLSGRTGIKNPDAPVNLIQKADCIEIIRRIINQNIWDDVFNAASTHHPTREDYYTAKAAEYKLIAPLFDRSATSTGKTISSEKLLKKLNFTFSEI